MLYDAAAGLYLTKTRAYNPKTGRFLQRDILDEDAKDGYKGFPFGKDAIGTNLYAWCGNNPVNMVDPMGTFSIKDVLRRGAQTVRSIARGIGAGYYGSQSAGGGGAYDFGYRIGSGTRAGIKKVAAAVEVVKPAAKLKAPVAAMAPSRDMVINNLRNLSVAGFAPLKQADHTNFSGMFGSEANVSPGGEAILGGVTMMLGATHVYVGITGAETSQQSIKNGVKEVDGIEVLDGCQCLMESKNKIALGGSLILVGVAMEVNASIRYFEDTVDELKNKVGDWF